MAQDRDHEDWMRGLLIAEREARRWTLEQTARAIARELEIPSLKKQSFTAWESGDTKPRVDQFAAWAAALGLRLEVDLVRPGRDQVTVRLPPAIAPIARDLAMLAPDDLERVYDLVRRLKPVSV